MSGGEIKTLGDRLRELESQERRQSGMPDIKGFLEEMKRLGVKVSTSIVVSYQVGGRRADAQDTR